MYDEMEMARACGLHMRRVMNDVHFDDRACLWFTVSLANKK